MRLTIPILATLIAGPALAQPAGVVNGHRSSDVSVALSIFVPGGQYLYTNKPGNALLEWAGIALGVIELRRAPTDNSICNGNQVCTGNSREAYLGAGLALACWGYGIWDADDAVRRWNDEHRVVHAAAISPAVVHTAHGSAVALVISLK